MNVILNTDEAYAVLVRVSAQLIDHGGLSEAGQDALRVWREAYAVGNSELDRFALACNEALGNSIDERTTRMVRLRGMVYVSEKDVRP
ncbi:MAG: hypothetical protein FJ035_10695 [Chloroflexi bacterium]|nr:hypothetical protein [Chloroflexota bacterium]